MSCKHETCYFGFSPNESIHNFQLITLLINYKIFKISIINEFVCYKTLETFIFSH